MTETQEKKELTVERAIEAYRETGWKPIDSTLVGSRYEEDEAGGPCGCIVGVLAAEELGIRGYTNREQKDTITLEAENIVGDTYGLEYGHIKKLEHGFDMGYGEWSEGIDSAAGLGELSRVRSSDYGDLGYKVAVKVAEMVERGEL